MKSMTFKTFALVILFPFLVAGCAEMSPTLKGGLIGAGVCGAAGAAAGAIAGEPGKGAAIGAVGCGIVGLALGEMYSQSQRQQSEASIPRPPSESYVTTLPSPSSQASGMPLLIANGTESDTDPAMSRQALLVIKELLSGSGIRFEDYTVSSAAKYPKSPTVFLMGVYSLASTMAEPAGGYRVNLRLSRADMEHQYFSANGLTLKAALSQALFGK